MPAVSRLRCACAMLAMAVGLTSLASAADLPDYMQPIAGTITTTPAEIADDNVLALNTAMFELYGAAGRLFQRNLLAKHPVILGLFSGAGGRFILYRPGMPPLEAPPVPLVYQLMKSTGHSTMALTEVVGPYLENPVEPVLARARCWPIAPACSRPWRRWMPRTCRRTGGPSSAPFSNTMSTSWMPA